MTVGRSDWTAGTDVVPYLYVSAMVPGHLLNWGVEWAFAAFTTLLGMYRYSAFCDRYPNACRWGLLILTTCLCISCVAYTGTLVRGTEYSGLRDIVDILKPAMIYFSCVAVLTYCPPHLARVQRACAVILAFSLICAIALILDVPVLGVLVKMLYGSTKTGFSEFFVRLSIPFENPNFLGLFAVMSLCLGLLYGDRPNGVLILLALAVAGLSGSRTAWITSILVLLMYVAISASSHVTHFQKVNWRTIVGAVGLVAAGSWVISNVLEEQQRVKDFLNLLVTFDFASDESYSERISMRRESLALIVERPFFGWGALKYSDLGVIDNQYYGILLRFGVIGSLIFLFAMAVALVTAYARAYAAGRGAAFACSIGVLMVWLWAGNFLENIRLVSLITILVFTFASATGNARQRS
jgi:O-antigen ligase